jgi:hypothetical protein
MQFDPYDLRHIQLQSYLREFFVKPDMSESVWAVAKFCMDHPSRGSFGFKFQSELAVQQFALACLLSCNKQLTWEAVKSYFVLQSNLGDGRMLTEYGDLDVVFILHEPGTMRNSIMGDTLSQVAVLRGTKKTFLLDTGGPPLSSPCFKIVTVQEAFKSLDSLGVKSSKSQEDFNI